MQQHTADIAFIAPYLDMARIAEEVIEKYSFPAQVYLGDHSSGVRAARMAMDNGAKIVISRGCTADLIRAELGIQVVEVGGCVYSVMDSLLKHTQPETRIAIASFRQFISIATRVCDILGRSYCTFAVDMDRTAQEVFPEVMAWRPEVLLGDVTCVRLACDAGFPAFLIDSNPTNILDALHQAMQVLENLHRHLASAQKLTAVLNCAQQGVVLVGKGQRIEEANKFALGLLGRDRAEVVGREIAAFFDSPELDETLCSGREAKDIIVTYNDNRLVVSAELFQSVKGSQGFVILLQHLVQIQEAEKNIRKKLLHRSFMARHTFQNIEFASPAMRHTVGTAREYGNTQCNIMIYGETGTGKELFAQSIHNAGPLARGPFVAVNCGALPGTLLESELFGYAPGAFTGASRSGKAGLFELAHEGTLFLDEITEMDLPLQSRFLRAMQEHEIMRVGDNKTIPVNVRIIAATNQSPEEGIRTGKLRADVFFRINVLNLRLPPLRERTEDIPLLFQKQLRVYAEKYGLKAPEPSGDFIALLLHYHWPGNVRELENLAEKFVVLRGHEASCRPLFYDPSMHDCGRGPEPDRGAGQAKRSQHAETGEQKGQMPVSERLGISPRPGTGECLGVDKYIETNQYVQANERLEAVIAAHITKVLHEEHGNITRAALRLGIDRNTLKRRALKGREGMQ